MSVQIKLVDLVHDIALHPEYGLGKLEQLKGMTNFYSRELTKKDRIVYSVDKENNTVMIHQYLGHYSDK